MASKAAVRQQAAMGHNRTSSRASGYKWSRNRGAAELAFSNLVLRIGHFRLCQQLDRRVDGTNGSGQGNQSVTHLR